MSEPGLVIGHVDGIHPELAPVFDWRGVCLICAVYRERDAERARLAACEETHRRWVDATYGKDAGADSVLLYRETYEELLAAANLPVERVAPSLDALVEAMNDAFEYTGDTGNLGTEPVLPFIDDSEAFWRPFAAKVIARLTETTEAET